MKHSNKKTVIITSILLILCLSILFTGCSHENNNNGFTSELDNVRSNLKYIIHAAGALSCSDSSGIEREYLGSNSMEGLEQCAAAGVKAIELDFNFTSDGKLVCIHDWYKEYAEEIENGIPLSLDEFLSIKIYGCFTPIWIEDVASFLRCYPDIVIITDIKDENLLGLKLIAESYPDLLDRFVVQIYNESEYEPVRQLGFDYIIFTLYRLEWNEKIDWLSLGRFSDKHPLVGFTFSEALLNVDGYLDGMLDNGIPLYIHTVNEDFDKYFAKGISGIYTDYIDYNLEY